MMRNAWISIVLATLTAVPSGVGASGAASTGTPTRTTGVTAAAEDVRFDDLARKPPMGWNSWNTFGCDINEGLIRDTADAMVATGLSEVGYEYVNIDDCWMAPTRDAQGRLQPDPERFPSGIRSLADYVHARGLKLGIYSTAGTGTCQRLPGSLDHEEIDAQTFADWGVDYLKYDHCFTEKAALPAIDRLVVALPDGEHSIEAESPDATRTGTATVEDCAGCSGGQQVTGLGQNRGTLTIPIEVPAHAVYDVAVAYTNGQDPRTSYYPTGYISVDGVRQPNRLRFPPSPSATTPTQLAVRLELTEGRHTITLSNPLTDLQVKQELFSRMRDALAATGRPIVYSINPNTQDGTSFEGIAHLWRTTQDIKPIWRSSSWYRGVADIIEENAPLWRDAGRGHWNDPDMLEVGVDIPGYPGLSDQEDRTHFTLWAMMAAPLIAGTDVRSMTPHALSTLTNEALVRIDQDPLSVAGRVMRDDGLTQVWVKPLKGGDRAVALYNSSDAPRAITATPEEMGLPNARSYRIVDVWTGRAWRGSGSVHAQVPAHGVSAYRIHPMSQAN